MRQYIDLHMHSTCSDDGEFTPTELVRQCKEAGIRIMSITDHDSTKGNAEARTEAEKLGIAYISGIELDCRFQGRNFHLLGYGFDDSRGEVAALGAQIIAAERNASRARLEKTRALGFDISEAELNAIANIDEGDIWTGETFGEVLFERADYREHPMLRPYRSGGERADNPYVNFYW
ncbi:MAG: PHP domain-containing protein, partial [Oscillospiraceae bacterium]|nr:PHP domain-containing protein [Oscillospiraceae bacterium]